MLYYMCDNLSIFNGKSTILENFYLKYPHFNYLKFIKDNNLEIHTEDECIKFIDSEQCRCGNHYYNHSKDKEGIGRRMLGKKIVCEDCYDYYYTIKEKEKK